MNILDTIINGQDGNGQNNNPQTQTQTQTQTPAPAPASAPIQANAHDFRRGAVLTQQQAEHAARGVAEWDRYGKVEYRGLGVGVQTLNNNPQDILQAAGMDWRTVPVQLAMRGKMETRDIPGMRALVRSDNGAYLSVASESYKPHQNAELMGVMATVARDNGLTIRRVGTFDGGTRIWAVARGTMSAPVAVGDTVAMDVVMRSGHEPGFATVLRAAALRLVCSNGAIVSDNKGLVVSLNHHRGLTGDRLHAVRKAIGEYTGMFQRYVEQVAAFYEVPLHKLAQRVFLADVVQPELVDELAKVLRLERRQDMRLGAQVVQRILDQEEARSGAALAVNRVLTNGGGRLLQGIIGASQVQVGKELSEGTLAHGYNAITYYNSHVRGRGAETGLESQLFGDGGRMAQEALAVGREYVRVLAPQVARQ